jgi:8-amino-7-oxononanoate synthase
MDARLGYKLRRRKENHSLRSLQPVQGVDLVSNDYLGWSRQTNYATSLVQQLSDYLQTSSLEKYAFHGSTGSRILSGETLLASQIEMELASFYHAPAGYLFHTGYTANIGLLSCIGEWDDMILYDELIHASVHDGLKLSRCEKRAFKHNDMRQVESYLQSTKVHCFIVVESIYSMDGDEAPLLELVKLARAYSACLIVDEAHATGLYGPHGRGKVVEYGLEHDVYARIHTFGKALNAEGAIVVGSHILRSYLMNYARSSIYTTFLPGYQLLSIRHAHQWLQRPETAQDRKQLFELIDYFKLKAQKHPSIYLLPSSSPIQSIVISGNALVLRVSQYLRKEGLDIRAIRFPTVQKGMERLRICLHAYNRKEEMDRLFDLLLIILANQSKL